MTAVGGSGNVKILKRTIQVLDWCEERIVYLFFWLLLLIGLYAMIDSFLVYQHANDNSLLKFKPGYIGETETEEREIQGLMAAWLTIADTRIDYPIMQGEDNREYLNKDPYGDYSLAGSIFLDSRNASDFTDAYSLIYGHHMEGDAMFGGLHAWLEENYYQEHRSAELIVEDIVYELAIFAVLDTDSTQEEIFAVAEQKLSTVLSFIKEEALYYDGEVLEGEGEELRIVAMSTCKAPDSVDRVVVVGRLGNPHPL